MRHVTPGLSLALALLLCAQHLGDCRRSDGPGRARHRIGVTKDDLDVESVAVYRIIPARE